MRKLSTLLFIFITVFLTGQQVDLANGIFGNEWIDYDKNYVKINISEDKLYKITYQELVDAGVPIENISPTSIRIQHFGEDVSFFSTTWSANSFTEDDYLLFYGQQNRSELDEYLFDNPEEDMMNQRYSLFSDTSGYYLSWENSINSNLIREEIIDYNQSLPETRVYVHRDEVVYSDFHYKPVAGPSTVRFTSFGVSEGFGTLLGNQFDISFDIKNRVNIGRKPRFQYRMGTNKTSLNGKVELNGQTFIEYFEPRVESRVLKMDSLLDFSLVSDRFDLDIETFVDHKVHLGHFSLEYTRTIDGAEGIPNLMTIPASNQDQFFRIKNYNGSKIKFINLTNRTLYNTEIQNNNLVLFIPASNQDQQILLVTETEETDVSPIEFRNFAEMDYDFIILTSKRLNNNVDGPNPIEAYASYKQSFEGGNYNPIIIDVEDLYDQFSFGIPRHSLAIRHFNHFVHSKWTAPKFIFIIGKSREYNRIRKGFQLEEEGNESFFVPTFGVPGGDNLLVSQVDFPTLLMPIGRIAARNKNDVFNYLDKVRLHDASKSNAQTIEDKLWTKRILHLSGGDKDIQASIRSYLAEMEEVIEDSKMGADVTTFYKFSSDPVDEAFSESLKTLINSGLELITFFGHSAPGVLDFSIGDVNDYSNYGKYPIMMALGCSAGNIHTTSENGISEEFVITKDKGGVVFLASASSAFASQQYSYGLELYNLAGNSYYGRPIGESVNAIIDSFKYRTDIGWTTFLEQLTFHGDPSLRLNSYENPDLIPDGTSARTNPTNVNSYEEDFEFCFDLVNIGSYMGTETEVEIVHELKNGQIVTDSTLIVPFPKFKDQVCVRLPIRDNSEVGEQTIKVIVDPKNIISESPLPFAESNNSLTVNGTDGYKFYVINNTAKPVYPAEFSIINDPKPTLIASTYNALNDKADYIIQIDTTGSFDSPLMVQADLKDQVAALQWEVPFELKHNTVYFWRIAADTTQSGLKTIWDESSFLYHQDIASGWNQSHYDQFSKDEFRNMMINENTRRLEFARNFKEIKIENRNFVNDVDRPHFYVDGNSFFNQFERSTSPGLCVTLIDTFGRFQTAPFPAEFNTYNHRNKPMSAFLFRNMNEKEVRDGFHEFMTTYVEDGLVVVLQTIIAENNEAFETETWAMDSTSTGINFFALLESHGAKLVRQLESKGGVPYVFSFVKGGEVVTESIAEDINDEILTVMQFPGFWLEGSIFSTPIGPADKWNKMTWNEDNTDVNDRDTTYVRIWGLDSNLDREKLLIDNNQSLDINLDTINANSYPYIQIEYYAKDQRFLTPKDLIEWRVFYDQKNELAFINDDNYIYYKDSIQEGDVFKIKLPVKNISSVGNPSVQANIYLKDNKNNIESENIVLGNMPPNNTKYIEYELETLDREGDYSLTLIVNEEQNPEENFIFNNFATKSFKVYKDKTNPTLDVTFDGNHILDNDIVSSKPFIQIALKDENPYLLLDDPDLYSIVLTKPDQSIDTVSFGDPRLNFIAATDSSLNKATIEFRPEFELEGDYLLSIQSSDKSQNIQGENAYEVSFKVILKNAVSNVFNYPNPFSTSTEFIFTLTGSTIPDQMVIQIMTVSGKVVREIRKEELGPLKLGENRTNYKWDGRDEYGNLLGNGVYLYRLITSKIDGKSYEKYDLPEGTDRYFKKGWGKMVIIR